MKLLRTLLPLAALLTVGASGCAHPVLGDAALFGTGLATGALLATDSPTRYERPDDREYPVYRQTTFPKPVYVVAPEDGTLVLPPTPERYAAPERVAPPPPFDAIRARTELARVDLTSCRETPAPRGYGHAKVTFNPSGDISKVVIDEPARLTPEAAKCIGDAIGRTTIPTFDGSLVTVGTTWLVP
jgi:hypothetical protein